MILDASKTDNINQFTAAGKKDSAADKASNNLDLNYDTFIKLLTTQLKNQDPTKPVETDQLTQQFASLGQVEQSIAANKNLEKLVGLFGQSQFSSNVAYIGKFVEAPGNFGTLAGNKAPFVYTLEAEAKEARVTVSDADGNVVYTGDGTKLAGKNLWVWNGKNNEGVKVADGTYVISVKATDASGKEIKVGTSSAGKVTSVETIEGKTYVALGDILVPEDQVFSVKEMPII